MAEIRIRVSAAADSSLKTVLDPLYVSAAKAKAVVIKEADAAAKGAGKAYADIAKQFAKREAEITTDAQKASQKRTQAALKEFDVRLKASKRARDEEEKDILRVAATAEKAEKRKAANAKREVQATARDIGGRVVSNIGSLARTGVGVAGTLLRGAGVDLGVESHVSNAVNLQKISRQISNQSYQPGVNERVNPETIKANIKEAADAAGFSREQAGAGLQAFVSKTGDLDVGMKALPELSRLAQASGADLKDVADAAGDVANNLGNVGDAATKAKLVEKVLAGLAGQGKLGAVEMKDLATQAAKIGAAASAIEGDAAENFLKLGGLLQMARAHGGAASATQSATSIVGLANTLKTPARVNEFKEQGIKVFNKQGQIRDVQELIIEALGKTGGDPLAMKKMFANVVGAKPAEAAADTFRRAKGEAVKGGATETDATVAGLQAVRAEFEKYQKAAMGEREITDSLNARMKDSDVKAQIMNNRFDDVAERLQSKLAPALERAMPGLEKLANWGADLLSYAADNPIKAGIAALGASIAKAGAEKIISDGVTSLIQRALGGAAGGAGGGMGLPGGGAGLALATAAAGASWYEASNQYDKMKMALASEGGRDDMASQTNMLVRNQSQQQGIGENDLVTPLMQLVQDSSGRDVQHLVGGTRANPIDYTNAAQMVGGGSAAENEGMAHVYASIDMMAQMNERFMAAQEKLKEVFAGDKKSKTEDPTTHAKLDAIAGKLGNLQVTVTNMPAGGIGGAPNVDQGGRAGFAPNR